MLKCVITRSTSLFPFPSALVFTVDYCDDQDTVVSGSADSTVRIWKMSTGQCLQTRYGHTDWVIKVRFGAFKYNAGFSRHSDNWKKFLSSLHGSTGCLQKVIF